MVIIDERPPDDPLQAEVVLHVRGHLRRSIRKRGKTAARDLGLLFGKSADEAKELKLDDALTEADPIAAAADKIAAAAVGAAAGGVPVVALARVATSDYKNWLVERRRQEPAFEPILASDLRTLLALSLARDLACAPVPEATDGRLLPILIEGETGTGKELLADAIRTITDRERLTKGYRPVQVSGMPQELINDELFGHEKGAYTDAREPRKGCLEEADGGTVLIDEIGDLPPTAQVRLLRFLQDHKLARLGSNSLHSLKVRIISATWHDLEADVQKRRFRRDLLHRIRAGMLRLPPLREREGAFTDIVPQMLRRMKVDGVAPITRSATDALAAYDWPGNLRELTSALHVAVANSSGKMIRLEDLPFRIQSHYLKLPVDKRAPGFITDPVDDVGTPPPVAVVEQRMAVLASEFERIPPPEQGGPVNDVATYFKGVPDTTPAHRAFLEKLDEAVVAERESRRLVHVRELWRAVAEALPAEAAAPATHWYKDTVARVTAASAAVQAGLEGAAVTESPWFRLLDDMRKMSNGQATGDDLNAILRVLQLVTAFAPQSVDFLREHLGAGGIRGVIDAILAKVVEKTSETEKAAALEATSLPPNLGTITRDDWVRIAEEHRTVAAMARYLCCDERSVRNHLKRHKVPTPAMSKGRKG